MELLRLGTDRADAALRTTAAYLFIYYLLRRQDVREVLDEVPQGAGRNGGVFSQTSLRSEEVMRG